MRNLVEYPIIKEEVIACLTRLIHHHTKLAEVAGSMGDMRPLLLQKAKEIVERSTDI